MVVEIRTRHFAFSWAGLIAVVSALTHDQTSIIAEGTAVASFAIGLADWISAQIQKYKGIYNQAAKPATP